MNTELEKKVIASLGNIRPYLQRDGGDVEFVELTEENIVKVRLLGHCAGCPHRQMTLKGGIEQILKEENPDVKAVEAVA